MVLQKCFILSEFLRRIFSYHVSGLSLSRQILYLFQTDWLMQKRMCSAASLCQVRGDVALRSLLKAKSQAASVI